MENYSLNSDRRIGTRVWLGKFAGSPVADPVLQEPTQIRHGTVVAMPYQHLCSIGVSSVAQT